jgi:hypothetical protein
MNSVLMTNLIFEESNYLDNIPVEFMSVKDKNWLWNSVNKTIAILIIYQSFTQMLIVK